MSVPLSIKHRPLPECHYLLAQILYILGLQPDSVALITQLLDASLSQNLPPPSFANSYQRDKPVPRQALSQIYCNAVSLNIMYTNRASHRGNPDMLKLLA